MYGKSVKIFFLLAVCGWIIPGRAIAQDSIAKWAVKPSYSLLQYKGELGDQLFNLNSRNDGLDAAFSRYVNPSVDLIMGVEYNRINISGTISENNYHVTGNLISPHFSVNYKFCNNYLLPDSWRWKPYLGAGFAYWIGNTKGNSYDLNGDAFTHFIDEVAFTMTLGVKNEISKRISFFVELNNNFATTEELDGAAIDMANDKYRGGRIGLFIKIGGPHDQDKDGVTDDKDECPDTPLGVEVDEKGCPKDRDKDGIPDYQDDCPDDPGLPQYNGCPDRDGDGIIDKKDDCPDLPGIPKYNGCPDSDGDGVIDPKDLSPAPIHSRA